MPLNVTTHGMRKALSRPSAPLNAFPILAVALILSGLSHSLPATTPVATVSGSPLKPASELISRQEKPKINPSLLEKAGSEPVSVVVSLSKQRVYLLVGGKVAVDSPISSGRRNGWTPTGDFLILEKDPNHSSNLYGNFVDKSGRIVRSGVSSRMDAAPSGTTFQGAPMKYFMRLTEKGVGMHAGILPGYPASHGCIRLPHEMAELIYSKVTVRTPVKVEE